MTAEQQVKDKGIVYDQLRFSCQIPQNTARYYSKVAKNSISPKIEMLGYSIIQSYFLWVLKKLATKVCRLCLPRKRFCSQLICQSGGGGKVVLAGCTVLRLRVKEEKYFIRKKNLH